MKRILLLAVSFAFLPVIGQAAQIAQSKMYCLSLRVAGANDQNGLNSLQFTTLNFGINNELAPDFVFLNSGYTNSAFVVLTDLIFDEKFNGGIGVDLPAGTDADGNGLPDFFEVTNSASASTEAAYNISGFGNGTATAQWSRDAGSSSGLCILTLHSGFQNYIFYHLFEIFEYTGRLSYTPGATNVSGSVNLTNIGNPAAQFQGPVQFTKITTNQYNLLSMQSVYWTNSSDQALATFKHLYSRDSIRPTNYSGYLEFLDGDPNTVDDDYFLWWLTISDSNDADHDGIPDFSDDPTGGQPRRPTVSLTRTPTNLLFTIRGDVGHLHQLQETNVLSSGTWPTVLSVTLTNDPQVVALPMPASSPKFWRVQAF